MKYISRLTALLLAMMMLLSSTVLAEGGIGVPDLKEDWLEQQYTIASYGQCGNDNKYCVQIDEIRGKTYAEIEDYLKYSIDDSALVEMLLGHHYYYHYLKGQDTELLCICGHHAHEVGADIGTELYFPYGDEKHLKDCPWGEPDTGIVAGSNSTLEIKVPDTAFPDGTTMAVVTEFDTETLNAIDEAILAAIKGDADYVMGSLERLDAYDITFTNGNDKVQPAEGSPVELTFTVPTDEDMSGLSVYHLTKTADGYTAELVASQEVDAALDSQVITVEGDKFSIYVVLSAGATWNKNNWKIVMTVGDSLSVQSTLTNSNNRRWSVNNNNILRLPATNGNQATINAASVGTTKLHYGTDSIEVVVLDAVGSDISNDIIFATVTVPYDGSGENAITEYNNTYGPYVMKIRFEDSAGNLIPGFDSLDYYTFDSDVPININTFAAGAPAGYTYDGAYFFWNGHTGDNADRISVSRVSRLSSVGNGGSYLYFDHGTTIDDWYQASGVLHIVYRPINEAYSVIFKDHEDTTIHSFAPKKADVGYTTIGQVYLDNLETVLVNQVNANHDTLGESYLFTGGWEVSYDKSNRRFANIDDTYSSTADLVNDMKSWRVAGDITIKAICKLNTGKLTINKTGMEAGESAIIKVTATDAQNVPQTYTVVLSGPNASVTLSNLLANSTYKVEESSWSWSYGQSGNPVSDSAWKIVAGNTVTCTIQNEKEDQWLHAEAGVTNDFDTSKVTQIK